MKEKYCQGACKEVMLMMQSMIDGEATEEEIKTVEEHTSHCESCRVALHDLSLIKNRIAGIAADPPCDLKEQIQRRITEENRSMAIERVRKSKKRTRCITGFVAAAAVLAVCVFGAEKYVSANGGLGRLAAMQDKFVSQDAAEEEICEIGAGSEAYTIANEAPQTMGVMLESDGTENDAVIYNREMILEDARAQIEHCGIKNNMYAEVFYANVRELPANEEAFLAGREKKVGIYETDDFASFVSESNVTVNGVQYEFTNGSEITSCGLEYGGSRVLVILVVG